MSVKVGMLAVLGWMGVAQATPPKQVRCEATICLAGAFTRTDGANPRLARLCQRRPGLVESCDGGTCQPLFHFAAIKPAQQALFRLKDTNQDGKVDAKDARRQACLVGYSWGGVNAVEVARRFLTDPRVAPQQRHLTRLELIDPFAPMTKTLQIPKGVARTVNYRHSKAPTYDCSARAPLGPYKGLPMACAPGAICVDYDFSEKPIVVNQTVKPANIGHCSIIRAIEPLLLAP
jgi:hypothetical protein